MNARSKEQLERATTVVDLLNDDINDGPVHPLDLLDALGLAGLQLAPGVGASNAYIDTIDTISQDDR